MGMQQYILEACLNHSVDDKWACNNLPWFTISLNSYLKYKLEMWRCDVSFKNTDNSYSKFIGNWN